MAKFVELYDQLYEWRECQACKDDDDSDGCIFCNGNRGDLFPVREKK